MGNSSISNPESSIQGAMTLNGRLNKLQRPLFLHSAHQPLQEPSFSDRYSAPLGTLLLGQVLRTFRNPPARPGTQNLQEPSCSARYSEPSGTLLLGQVLRTFSNPPARPGTQNLKEPSCSAGYSERSIQIVGLPKHAKGEKG